MEYKCYNEALKWLKLNREKSTYPTYVFNEIELLVSQYYFGIDIKKELYFKLVGLNAI